MIPNTHTIADMGTKSVIVMKNMPMKNERPTTNPLNINLPNGKMAQSRHIWDLEIPGLPHVLEGHVIPDINVASFVGIQGLCKVGCIIVFTNTACYVKYKGKLS